MKILFKLKRNNRIQYIILILIIILLQVKVIFDRFPTVVHLYEKWFLNLDQDFIEFYGRKYVVISSTLEYHNDHYMFTLPMAAQSWRRLGFEPIVLVAQASEPNKLAKVVLKYLDILKIKVVNIKLDVENYEVLIGMVSRLFCSLLPDDLVSDDDFIITSDTDLFPINEKYFRIDAQETIKLWNHGICEDFEYKRKMYEMHTLLHIGMLKRQWREVMQLNKSKHQLNGTTILKYLKDFYGESYVKKNSEIKRGNLESHPYWFIDQMTISVNIDNYVNRDKKANVKKIKFRGTRLNRGFLFNPKWYDEVQFNYLTDFHSFHSDVFKNWSYLRDILSRMFDKVYKIMFDEYFLDYMMVRKDESYFKNHK